MSHVTHIVLFKWKPGTSEAAVADVVLALKGLKDAVPGIDELEVGTNFSERSQGYSLALQVRFADRGALDAYGPHPAHQRIVNELILPIAEGVLVADYEP